MAVIKVALLGFGTVGEGVYRTIKSHQEELKACLGQEVEVAGILIKDDHKVRTVDPSILVTKDIDAILQIPHLNLVIEAIVGKDPGIDYLRKAIIQGCHVITANKELFAHHAQELLQLAKENHVSVGFEATVAGGVPIIQTIERLLNINQVRRIEGILNGTSNFILTEMRENKIAFQDALKLAQEKGFAEADPTNDIEGIDAFYKLVILSEVTFGAQPEWEAVEIKGISTINLEKIHLAEQLGLRFKHVASISRDGDGELRGSVQPVLVSKAHSLYHIEGVENAINLKTDIVGSVTLQGPGAGMYPTASAIVEDVVHLFNKKEQKARFCTKRFEQVDEKKTENSWLVFCSPQSRKEIETFSGVKVIEVISSSTIIINARKETIQEQFQNIDYYPILGEYNPIKRSSRLMRIKLK